MRQFKFSATALALIGVATLANATSLSGSATDPTGVDGLVVGGATYDVTFGDSSYLATFPSGPNFATPTAAGDAASALATFLGGQGVTGLGGNTCGLGVAQPECQLYVPSGDVAGLVDGSQAHNQGSGWSMIGPESLALDSDALGLVGAGYDEWAVFSAANANGVPEPATLSLIGLGLAAAGIFTRRRRRH